MKVSVLCYSYSPRKQLLPYALESIKKQKEYWDEVIFLEDGQLSLTKPIVDDVLKGLNYKVIDTSKIGNREDKRISHVVNFGSLNASGDVLAHLSCDDLWVPNHLKTCLEEIQNGKFLVVDQAIFEHPIKVEKISSDMQYTYVGKLPRNHQALTEALKFPNFIVHDCAVHKRTNVRWNHIEGNIPVDWEFWCKFFEVECGLDATKVCKLNSVGSRVVYPGYWRENGSMDQILRMRYSDKIKGDAVKKAEKAINVSGKTQNITSNGRKYVVRQGESIDIELVRRYEGHGSHQRCIGLYDGFVVEAPIPNLYEEENEKPTFDQKMMNELWSMQEVPTEDKGPSMPPPNVEKIMINTIEETEEEKKEYLEKKAWQSLRQACKDLAIKVMPKDSKKPMLIERLLEFADWDMVKANLEWRE